MQTEQANRPWNRNSGSPTSDKKPSSVEVHSWILCGLQEKTRAFYFSKLKREIALKVRVNWFRSSKRGIQVLPDLASFQFLPVEMWYDNAWFSESDNKLQTRRAKLDGNAF